MAAAPIERWIVVGVDGSPSSAGAVRWACLLAPVLGADVAAVHAVGLLERLDGELVPAHSHRADIATVMTRDWCAPLSEAGLRHRVHLREQPAVDALLGEIADLHPHLAIVGTRGAGLSSAESIGSTALRLLHDAPVPVVVVPDTAQEAPPALRRVLVGVDGGAPSLAAIDWAAELARRTGASCELLTATLHGPEAEQDAGPDGGPDEVDHMRRLGASIEAWSTPFRWNKVPLRTTVCGGDPADQLVRRAREVDADLVVLGASGRGPAGAPLAGSTSRRVAHAAGCAVAVVRVGAPLTRQPVPAGRSAQLGG
jgi:nucleotide-binding universal stress UspA family protein